MPTKQEHLDWIKAKGSFTVDCSHAIFTLEEIEILEKWGHWFRALTDGTLVTLNETQSAFVDVAQGRRDPFSPEEKAWFKYINRKRLEQEKGDQLKTRHQLDDDPFYSRADAKKLRGMMYSVINKTHRE